MAKQNKFQILVIVGVISLSAVIGLSFAMVEDYTKKGLDYTDMADIQQTLATNPEQLKELRSIKKMMNMFTNDFKISKELAQAKTIGIIKGFANNPDNNYAGKKALMKLIDDNSIKLFD